MNILKPWKKMELSKFIEIDSVLTPKMVTKKKDLPFITCEQRLMRQVLVLYQVKRLQNLFDQVKIPIEVPTDMIRFLWWKFMINVGINQVSIRYQSGINQVSILLRMPFEVFQTSYEVRNLMKLAMPEVDMLASKENVFLYSILSVYQDFHAKISSKKLTAVLSYTLKDKIKQKYHHRQYVYQLNFNQVLLRMEDTVLLLFTESKSKIKFILEKLHQLFLALVEPVRSGRKYSGKAKVQRKGCYLCYKPIR